MRRRKRPVDLPPVFVGNVTVQRVEGLILIDLGILEGAVPFGEDPPPRERLIFTQPQAKRCLVIFSDEVRMMIESILRR